MKALKYLLIVFVSILVSLAIYLQLFWGLSFYIKEYSNNTRDIETANSMYAEDCSSCHGESVEEFVSRDWVCDYSYAGIFQSISNGCNDAKNHDYDKQLSLEEIHGLTALISDLHEGQVGLEIAEGRKDWSGIIHSEDLTFQLDTVMLESRIDSAFKFEVPWGMEFLPSGDLLVTERSGLLYKIGLDSSVSLVKGVPDVVENEIHGGLLDIAVHPDFSENNFVFLSLAKRGEDGNTVAVVRAKLIENELVEAVEIFEALPYINTDKEYGSRLKFDGAGALLVTIGNRNAQHFFPWKGVKAPQHLENDIGKIHRINIEGKALADNPLSNNDGLRSTVFSYGHRNPQGLTINPSTGSIWSSEHGPRGGDEVNFVKPGLNYGWPIVSHGLWYDGTRVSDLTEKEGMESPKHYWFPSIAPCGMDFVSGENYPKWKGDLLVSSLRYQHISRLKMDGDKIIGEERILNMIGRIRDVQMGSDGYIYIAVEKPGAIYRIMPLIEGSQTEN